MKDTFKDYNEIESSKLNEYANVMRVQNDQSNKLEDSIKILKTGLNDLSQDNLENNVKLDELLAQAEELLDTNGSDKNYDNILTDKVFQEIEINNQQKEEIQLELEQYRIRKIDTIDIEKNWERFWVEVNSYALKNKIDFSDNPYDKLLTKEQKKVIIKKLRDDYTLEKPNCDKYDYLLASISGIISGFIDVIFVGSSILGEKGILSKATDKQSEKLVEKFSTIVIEQDKKNGISVGMSYEKATASLQNRVQYLEKKFQVPYDARYVSDLKNGEGLKMNLKNHHTVSLAHSPGLEGLFFSILDQFTNKGTYFSNGTLKRSSLKNDSQFVLRGNTIFEKLFFGFVNWFGHNMSDLIGSNSTVGKGNRGSGLPIPLTQFFQLFDNTRIGSSDDLAKIARQVFEQGYDLRHGAAAAIPVVLNELIIRFLWGVKQYFYHRRELKQILAQKNSAELRRMLLVGHGCLCLTDGIDATVRGVGNPVLIFSRMNFVAWSRLAYAGFQEVRSIYGENALNIEMLDKDLEIEWKNIFVSSNVY